MIETVGVGQSETEVADVADTVAVVVQPGSGDVLQFLKAGIMEVPDVLVVTKADLGRDRAARAGRPAAPRCGRWARATSTVLAVSSLAPPSGIDELVDALRSPPRRASTSRPAACGRGGCTRWRTSPPSTGERGLRALGGRREADEWLAAQDPGLDVAALERLLSERADQTVERVAPGGAHGDDGATRSDQEDELAIRRGRCRAEARPATADG